LDTNDQNDELKKQCLASLSNSRAKIQEALLAKKEKDAIIDKIWKAYSQAELAIGIAKLAFRNKLETKIGKFRDLYTAGIPGGKTLQMPEKLEMELSASKSWLELAISTLNEGKVTEGLEHARKGRDILKSILLENSSSTGSKKKRSR